MSRTRRARMPEADFDDASRESAKRDYDDGDPATVAPDDGRREERPLCPVAFGRPASAAAAAGCALVPRARVAAVEYDDGDPATVAR